MGSARERTSKVSVNARVIAILAAVLECPLPGAEET